MEAQIKNKSGNLLAETVKANLAETQHRFELHDPFMDATYRFHTANAAIAKADEFGATRFQGRTPDGKVSQINKINNEWRRDDGQSINDIQKQIDNESLAAIQIRSDQLNEAGRNINPKTAQEMAQADAQAFRRIQNPAIQDKAALQLLSHTRTYNDYKKSLNKAAPNTVQQINDLDAATRKPDPQQESNNPLSDRKELDAYALDRVARSRSRDNQQALEALGFNLIEPDGKSQKSASNKVESDEIFTASQNDHKTAIPPDIEKQYQRVDNKYYYSNNNNVVAFEDKGNKLETKSNSESIASSMVRIAEARGWDEIKVSGSETFRREVWLQAAARDMHIKGYKPSEQDKEALAKRLSQTKNNTIVKNTAPFRARENQDHIHPNTDINKTTEKPSNKSNVGQLLDHGEAHYLHDNKNEPSYFVTIQNKNGEKKTTWGIDLNRAINESSAQVGDEIMINHEGKKTITLSTPVRDDNKKIVGYEKKQVHRNSWNIKMAESFANKTPEEAVKEFPELAKTVAAVSAIEKKMNTDKLTPHQQSIINKRVLSNAINSIEQGHKPKIHLKKEIPLEKKEEREYTR